MNKGAVLGALLLGAIIGGMTVEIWLAKWGASRPSAQLSGQAGTELQRLTQISPTQSHAMKDVESHWANLWFAAQKKNWPAANFFIREARQTMRWAVLIRPERVLPGGGTFDMKGQYAALDPTAFNEVAMAVEDEDLAQFETTYKEALIACHACHTAAGLPFLRPEVPVGPPPTILNFDPVATK
jgi:hypothetical protein